MFVLKTTSSLHVFLSNIFITNTLFVKKKTCQIAVARTTWYKQISNLESTANSFDN